MGDEFGDDFDDAFADFDMDAAIAAAAPTKQPPPPQQQQQQQDLFSPPAKHMSMSQALGGPGSLAGSKMSPATSPSTSPILSANQASLSGTLQRHWGYSGFRDGQPPGIEAALAGRDVTVFWATGSGKSICYQLPALHLDKVVVVISPLISLMQDQVRRPSPVFGSRCRRVSCPLAQGQPCVRPRPTAPRAGR